MKTKRNSTRALVAALAIAAVATGAWAKPEPEECGLIGTWWGQEPGDIVWLAVHTPGSRDSSGEMLMDWVYVNPNLLGDDVARLTPGRGVWQQVRKGEYKYTWYAYGLNADGVPLYSVRVSGVATNTDCDNVAIDYTYEIFFPPVPPHLMSGQSVFTAGQASQVRVPLTVTTP